MSELIYGRRAVLETLRARRRHIFRLWLEGSSEPKRTGVIGEILAQADELNVPSRPVKGGLFDKLATQQANAQGVALEVGAYPYVELAACLQYARHWANRPYCYCSIICKIRKILAPSFARLRPWASTA
ncbi:MAG: RNA methyltransferase substrate-binding domain-containing protein [Caldilineaceae bacterium]